MKLSNFGPRLIGQQAFDEQQLFVAEKRHKYGPRLMGDRPALKGNQPDPERIDLRPGADLSIEDLKRVLANNPHFVTMMLEREVDRPRGARVQALKLIRGAIPEKFAQKKKIELRIDKLLQKATGDTGTVYEEEKERELKKAKAVREQVEKRRKSQAAQLKKMGKKNPKLEAPLPSHEAVDPAEDEGQGGDLPDDLEE